MTDIRIGTSGWLYPPCGAERIIIQRDDPGTVRTLAHVTERVEPFDLMLDAPLRWEPNAPDAVLMSDDVGRAALGLRAHADDADQRSVVLRFGGAILAQMSPPNDEALPLHRLYNAGLRELTWFGVVRDSSLVEHLRPMWSDLGGLRVVPLHFIASLKECVVEVVAENVDCYRIDQRPHSAVVDTLSL